MLSFDDVHTLVDIVIANLIQVDLVSRVVLFGGVMVIVVVQAKDGFYHD
jgi:hypothetical protein